MKLYKQNIEFDTLETIKAMVEVSKVQKERLRSLNGGNISNHPNPMEYMTSIGFGRCSGQTEAIRELIVSGSIGDVMVVTHNHRTAVDLYQRYGIIDAESCEIWTRGFNSDKLKGMKFDKGIIFDVCSSEMIRRFFVNSGIVGIDPKFVVNVSPY